MEELIEWLDQEIQLNKDVIASNQGSSGFNLFVEEEIKTIELIKEYLTDYEKLAKDYRDVVSENKLLKVEKMALEGMNIYEEMRMKYHANRRKWGARYV
jgi:gp18